MLKTDGSTDRERGRSAIAMIRGLQHGVIYTLLDDNKLSVQVPGGMTDEIREIVGGNKEEILTYMTTPPGVDGDCVNGHPVEWAFHKSGIWLCHCYDASLRPAKPRDASEDARRRHLFTAQGDRKMTRNPATHAVIDSESITISIHHDRKSRPVFYTLNDAPETVLDLLLLACNYNIHTFWVQPGTRISSWTEANKGHSDEWKIELTRDKGEESLKSAIGHRKNGSFEEKRRIRIIWVERTSWQWGMQFPVTKQDMLSAIYYLEDQLGTQMVTSPGLVGREIVRRSNSTHKREGWLSIALDNEGKPLFDRKTLPKKMGFAFAHKGLPHELIEDERFEHYDKNSAYLSSCLNAYVPAGDPEHVPLAAETRYDSRIPGYWKLKYTKEAVQALEFNPLYRTVRSSQEWVTTPLLNLLLHMRMPLRIEEAYIWKSQHRILDKFAEEIYAARQAFKQTQDYFNQDAARLAEYSIKRIATATTGLFRNPDTADFSPSWFRPEWDMFIVEDAKAKLIYRLLQIKREQGLEPEVVRTDEILYRVPPGATLASYFKNSGLGGWKHHDYHAITVTPAIADALNKANTAAKAMKDLRTLVIGG